MTDAPNADYCRCGRIDKHDPHYWKGRVRYVQVYLGRESKVRPLYWCAGYVRVEGGWHEQ